MKKITKIISLVLLLGTSLVFNGCKENTNTISIAASELPHARLLKECIQPIVKEKGYDLKVTVLNWKIQNDSVRTGDYFANYFQHIPYLKSYEYADSLQAICKVHYEKLSVYAKDTSKKTIENGSSIEVVNDPSNLERALKLLESYNILSIKDTNYDENGDFNQFDFDHPNNGVIFSSGYENCTLTCLPESSLCASLEDYNFGVIPGNTALTGFGEKGSLDRIVMSEKNDEKIIDEKANVVVVKKENATSEKAKILVEAFKDERVSAYIQNTFSSFVIYHYVDLLNQ